MSVIYGLQIAPSFLLGISKFSERSEDPLRFMWIKLTTFFVHRIRQVVRKKFPPLLLVCSLFVEEKKEPQKIVMPLNEWWIKHSFYEEVVCWVLKLPKDTKEEKKRARLRRMIEKLTSRAGMPRTSRIFCPKNFQYSLRFNYIFEPLDHFYPAIPYPPTSSTRKRRINPIRFWSLVTVRNQLPAPSG